MTHGRTAVRVLIIKDRQLLLVKGTDHDGEWCLLPGSGQKKHDTLAQTLQRECLEETGYTGSMGPLVLVRECIATHHEFKNLHPDFYQAEDMVWKHRRQFL